MPSLLLRIDGIISTLFGLSTLLFQLEIFSTAVDLKGAGVTGTGQTLLESSLRTLSGYYVLVGVLLLLLAKLPAPFSARLCVAMLVHHSWMIAKGLLERRGVPQRRVALQRRASSSI